MYFNDTLRFREFVTSISSDVIHNRQNLIKLHESTCTHNYRCAFKWS